MASKSKTDSKRKTGRKAMITSLYLPKELVAQIDQAAARDERSRSKWIARALRKALADAGTGNG